MTQNQKILVGLGAVAVGYYFYKRKIDGKGWNPLSPSKGGGASNQGNVNTPQKPYMPQVNPYSEGGALQPRSIPHAHRLKEDFSGSVMTRPNVYANVTFKKGQIISALKNPYLIEKTAVGKGSLTTTPTGGLPNFEMSGQQWINIPERFLEKI